MSHLNDCLNSKHVMYCQALSRELSLRCRLRFVTETMLVMTPPSLPIWAVWLNTASLSISPFESSLADLSEIIGRESVASRVRIKPNDWPPHHTWYDGARTGNRNSRTLSLNAYVSSSNHVCSGDSSLKSLSQIEAIWLGDYHMVYCTEQARVNRAVVCQL